MASRGHHHTAPGKLLGAMRDNYKGSSLPTLGVLLVLVPVGALLPPPANLFWQRGAGMPRAISSRSKLSVPEVRIPCLVAWTHPLAADAARQITPCPWLCNTTAIMII